MRPSTYLLASALFTLVTLNGCGDEGVSSDPTPGQLTRALSDPLLIEATDILASDGLAIDPDAASVVAGAGHDWSVRFPVVRLYTGGLAPDYESLVFDVIEDVAEVYFVLPAEDALDDPTMSLTDAAESTAPPRGDALVGETAFALQYGPWAEWWDTGWWCGYCLECPRRGLFLKQRRGRSVFDDNGNFLRRQQQDRKVFRRCGGC